MNGLPPSIDEAGRLIRAGSVTCADLTKAAFDRSDQVDARLGVYLHRRREVAMAEAMGLDEELRSGYDRGPLHGIPVGVKDVFATRDEPTTAQSLVMDPTWNQGVDAPVIARLRSAGAVITGKTTTMEFAAGLPDPDKPFPVPRNPWNSERWSGGSSSGTASGLASGCFLGGLGTDTLGSIRGPAAFCGVTGLKPTFGRVPKSLVVPLVRSFDHAGPMARSARDCATMLEVIAGYDSSDPLCADIPVPAYVQGLTGSLEGVRIGVERINHSARPGVDASTSAAFESAVQALSEAGAEVHELVIPHTDQLQTACTVAVLCEAFNGQRDNLRTRWEEFGRETRFLLALGALFSGSDLIQARRVIDTARIQVSSLLSQVDVIACLTAGAGAPVVDGLSSAMLMTLPIFTHIWDGLRNPVMSVPIGFTTDGLPVGMQIVGRHWDEATVLRVGDAYQASTDWHTRAPNPPMG